VPEKTRTDGSPVLVLPHEKRNPMALAFAVSMRGVIIRQDDPLVNSGPYALLECGADNTIVPIDLMPELFITNLQSVHSTVEQYSLSIMVHDGSWEPLLKILRHRYEKPNLFFAHVSGAFTVMDLTNSLDDVLSELHGIPPGATASGAVYFAFPASHQKYISPIRIQASVADFTGHSFSGEIHYNNLKGDSLDPGIRMKFGPKANPSDYHFSTMAKACI
jgi:hypothetical protein